MGAAPYNEYQSYLRYSYNVIKVNKYEIDVKIKERYARITYLFDFDNANEYEAESRELKFDFTIDPNSFIAAFEADIDGQIFFGETKGRKKAKFWRKKKKKKKKKKIAKKKKKKKKKKK